MRELNTSYLVSGLKRQIFCVVYRRCQVSNLGHGTNYWVVRTESLFSHSFHTYRMWP